MIVVLVGGFGGWFGYRWGMSRPGAVALAVVAIGSSASQIGHVLVTRDREALTLLPTVAGLVLVLSMLLGVASRGIFRRAAAVA